MRKIAIAKNHSRIRQVILYQDENGVYLFPCTSLEDGFAEGDQWYEDLETAESVCMSEYGITNDDWQHIPDPVEYCLHDWVEPVRVVEVNTGKPQWGQLEKLTDGVWKEIEQREGQWVCKVKPSSAD